MKFAIISAGAIGLYYGAKLVQSGNDVYFLCRSNYNDVNNNGIYINSINGDFHVRVSAYNNIKELPLVDVALITLKTYANHLFEKYLPVLFNKNPKIKIITLQNGLGNEEEMAKHIPAKNIIGGVAFICANRIQPNRVEHTAYGYIKMGPYSDEKNITGLEEINSVFNKAGIDSIIEKNIEPLKWEKLVWNVPFNALSVILNATTSEMMSSKHISNIVESIMHEIQNISATVGYKITNEFIFKMLENTKKMDNYKTSMLLDYRAGNPIEIEPIIGKPLRYASKFGITTPYIKFIYSILKYMVEK